MTALPLGRVTGVLFDLDGTLIDSAPGITECLAATVAHFGGPVLDPTTLVSVVGPPVIDTLGTYLSVPVLPQAVEHYRSLYWDRGLANSTVFGGIPALLGMLRELGVPVAVATSKRGSHARAILDHHGLAGRFSVVAGAAEDDTAADKTTLIGVARTQLGEAGAHPVMIGDRSFDIAGALAAGIPSVFAAWGYGAPAEGDGASLVADSPPDLSELLTPHLVQGVQ